MDIGIWLLRCGGCHETFELEITDSKKVLDAIKDMPCPHCQATPRLEMDRTGHVNWHEIVKFSYSKTSP